MTIVTISGEPWVVGVTWRRPVAWRALRFAFPPLDTHAFVDAGGQPGFVTDRGDAAFAGVASLGAALRGLPGRPPWIAAVACDDGRVVLVGHDPAMPHLAPETVLETPHDLPALARFLDNTPVTLHATPSLGLEGARDIDLASLPVTGGMRLRQRRPHAIPWPAVGCFAAGAMFMFGVLILAALLFVRQADAQEPLPLPLPPAEPLETTVTVIDEAAPPAPPAEPDRQEAAEPDLDEATAALVTMLAATDTGEGPPMAECAIDLLRTRLAAAVAPDDILAATALEDELLRLCLARQKLVGEVLATELQLAAMVRGESGTEASSLVIDAPPQVIPEPPPLPTLDQLTLPQVLQEPAGEVEEAVEADPAPPYVWSTMLGTAGNMRAAVTDGSHVWWVREGDILPGGWQVVRIATQPPGVSLRHAETGDWALAHGADG